MHAEEEEWKWDSRDPCTMIHLKVQNRVRELAWCRLRELVMEVLHGVTYDWSQVGERALTRKSTRKDESFVQQKKMLQDVVEGRRQ